jgi:hypothetical protein
MSRATVRRVSARPFSVRSFASDFGVRALVLFAVAMSSVIVLAALGHGHHPGVVNDVRVHPRAPSSTITVVVPAPEPASPVR